VGKGISRERFIRLGAVLGVGAAGAWVLAACGGGSGNSGSGNSGSGNSGSGNGGGGGGKGGSTGSSGKKAGGGAEKQASGGQALARASEVGPGSAVKFEDSGSPAVLIHLESGDFVAYSAVCTHQNCEVAYKNRQLACPCHGSVFDPANGAQVVIGPAQRPLPEIPVQVKRGEVLRT
jgi:Rieske Fe-S protein